MRLKPHSDGCLGKTQRVRNGNVLRITWLYVLILLPLPYAFADYLDSYHLLSDFCSTFGLAVIFDDEFRLLSAGIHNKNALYSFGVKFHGEDLVNRV